MIEVSGLIQSQVIDICTKVAKNHNNKSFSYFESDDIEQQAWIIILDKIGEFDPSKGTTNNIEQSLENWLNTIVSRRLSNFYRDKFKVPQKQLKSDKSEYDQVKRQNLMKPLDISYVSDVSENNDIVSRLVDGELWQTIIAQLSPEYLDILDSILSGEKINCYYKNKLIIQIKNIMDEYNE